MIHRGAAEPIRYPGWRERNAAFRGQRQRLAIARALLRQPALLILDEPTNHLDNETILRLAENLRSIDERPAILIISHQNSVVSAAQHMYTIEEGRLILNERSVPVETALSHSTN